MAVGLFRLPLQIIDMYQGVVVREIGQESQEVFGRVKLLDKLLIGGHRRMASIWDSGTGEKVDQIRSTKFGTCRNFDLSMGFSF